MSNKVLISYSLALEIIQQVAKKHHNLRIETIDLLDAKGRILGQDIVSAINVPSFNNSAMDGFAIDSQTVNAGIKKAGKITLKVDGRIQAGDKTEIEIDNHKMAWEIMTGAPVPDAFDAVIQIENVTINTSDNNKSITIKEEIKAGRNIRKLGTDYQINQSVVNKYTQIQSQHIMALATIGIKQIAVIEKVKVAILSTGNELAKKSSLVLNSGKIFNSNQPYLQTFCENLNCTPRFIGRCKDKIDDFNQLIDSALEKQVKIIFSTGAVSMGKFDFIPQALLQRGVKIHFHKAKIRPGKPILFAELPDGTIYFGLPGNPIAAASGMRFFVSPFIQTMLGLPKEKPLKALLINPIYKKQGFRTFAKAFAAINDKGQLCVDMLFDQGSYQSRSFAQSNCWLILPEDKESIAAGELVEIAPMIPNQIHFQ